MTPLFTSSRPVGVHEFTRRPQDPSARMKAHGPIQPMAEPGLWARLFRRNRK